ncbi:MAG TPA: tyrosine-protein phosphatase [Bryobacteraceae bacterium]|nr:tyrosine-protein phosphatase [Bryobacteraceae bacterium]
MGITNLTTICAAAAALTFGSFILEAADQPQSLNNFQEVSDTLCRGAQPSASGFRELAQLGVHTVLDLRGGEGRSSHEAEIVRSLGMQYVNVPLDGYQAPTAEQVSKIFTILNAQGSGKVFVHCRRGADRTGTVLAMYRIQHDHWTNEKALSEAKTMKMASSERLMQKFVLDYQPTTTTVAAVATAAPAIN